MPDPLERIMLTYSSDRSCLGGVRVDNTIWAEVCDRPKQQLLARTLHKQFFCQTNGNRMR